MSNEPRTIRESGIGRKVITCAGLFVNVLSEAGDGWFKCRTPEGINHELHGSCTIKMVKE